MAIGKMREVVVFKQNNGIVAKGAGWQDGYSDLLTTRGQLIDRSGNAQLAFGVISNNSFMTLICRFQTALESSLRSDTRIVISNIWYKPTTWKLIDQLKHIYQFEIQSQTN